MSIKYTDAVNAIVEVVNAGELSEEEALDGLREALASRRGLSIDASVATLAAILHALPEGKVTTPGAIVMGLKRAAEKRGQQKPLASAQGVARRITASPLISLTEAARCISGLKSDLPKNPTYSVKVGNLHSCDGNDYPLDKALNLADVPHSISHDHKGNAIIIINAERVADADEIDSIVGHLTI